MARVIWNGADDDDDGDSDGDGGVPALSRPRRGRNLARRGIWLSEPCGGLCHLPWQHRRARVSAAERERAATDLEAAKVGRMLCDAKDLGSLLLDNSNRERLGIIHSNAAAEPGVAVNLHQIRGDSVNASTE